MAQFLGQEIKGQGRQLAAQSLDTKSTKSQRLVFGENILLEDIALQF